MSPSEFLTACAEKIGIQNVLTGDDQAAYLTDWRDRYHGKALATLRPGTTMEVSALVKLCNQAKISIVPQGGNTGLCGGATPDSSGKQVILSLQRLNKIRAVDTANLTMTIEAGCVLETLQSVADEANCLFPLSLAAEGSCTIGGNLSTNAGGTAVLRYGNTRELCLGLEVVTAQGEIWNGLRGLRKDNTGYDLRDLFIGAEGTLGIITAAVMKIFPKPKASLTAIAALATPQDAIKFLQLAQAHAGPMLTGFELFSDYCLALVLKHFPTQRSPFLDESAKSPQFVLLELSDHHSREHVTQVFEQMMESALEGNFIQDAVVAQSAQQSKDFWHLRESISLAQAAEGKNLKHDISLPISQIPAFLETTDALIQQKYPGTRMVTFGHLGDGNLHYNISPNPETGHDAFLIHQNDIASIIYDSVAKFGGSFSAEHGIGQLKISDLTHYKSQTEIALMRAIKVAFDPNQLLNPRKVL